MLSINDVTFGYTNQPVFEDLNFKLEHGEFVFLIGKSGSGKSTLMQLIYMNLLPQSGYIRVGDFNSSTIKKKELPYLRRKLGVIFQDCKLLEQHNVYENLSFVLEVTGTPRREIKRKVYDALSLVGLSHKLKNMPKELSGGEQQRVAIARAIINDPHIILADEPTGNLDPQTSAEIMDILKKINSRGTSIICATHNYSLVKSFNTRIVKIENGKIFKVVLKEKESVK